MNNEIKEKFLPIGTVVLLKDGIRKLMITSYCPMPKGEAYNKDGKIELGPDTMFDYGACCYPEGIISNKQTYMFNHNQIREVCYMGYESEDSKKFDSILKEEINKKNNQ